MPVSSKAVEPAIDPVPWTRYLQFFTLAAGGALADLATKAWAFQWLGMPGEAGRWWLWEGYVGVETALNRGAVFGIGQGYVGLFAGLSMLAACGILVWLFWFKAAHDRYLTLVLGGVSGGIVGNLYDRLGLWGEAAVRDWILLAYGPYTWPNFNIADTLLVTGAVLLAWHAYRHG